MDCIYIAPLSKALYNLCLSFTHSHANGNWLPCKVPTSSSNIRPNINGTFTYMQVTHAVGTDAPHTITPMVTCIQQRFPPLVFTHRDFPWLPDSFHGIMNCGLRKTNDLELLGNIVFELTDNSLTMFGTKCWTTTHPRLKRLSLWWMLLLYSLYLDKLTCYYLNC